MFFYRYLYSRGLNHRRRTFGGRLWRPWTPRSSADSLVFRRWARFLLVFLFPAILWSRNIIKLIKLDSNQASHHYVTGRAVLERGVCDSVEGRRFCCSADRHSLCQFDNYSACGSWENFQETDYTFWEGCSWWKRSGAFVEVSFSKCFARFLTIPLSE